MPGLPRGRSATPPVFNPVRLLSAVLTHHSIPIPARPSPAVVRAAGFKAAVLVASLAGLIASCATGPERQETFVGRAAGATENADVAEGLNPLAGLDVCTTPTPAPPNTARVLISPPAYFSREATDMILTLRQALARSPHGQRAQMWVAPQPLRNASDAVREGRLCNAVIVLWEPYNTSSLELTLPEPGRVPLRGLIRDRLCEFGSHGQQVAILFFTITGLAALSDNRYDEAVYYMEAANRIDLSCLQLPLPPSRAAAPAEGGSNR